MARTKIRANVVGTLSFRCRDIGYGVEEGTIDGYFTGEVDEGGKRTFTEFVSSCPELMTRWLFPDEIVSWEPGETRELPS